MVEEREASLYRVGHADPIALRREQVFRQEDGRFQVLRLRQRAPLPETGRQRERRSDLIARRACRLHLRREEALAADRIVPADTVRIERVVCLLQSLAEKALQVSRVAV